MGFLDNLFGNNIDENQDNKHLYIPLELISQLDEIEAISEIKPVVIFKHSTRCSISRFALKQFESNFKYPKEKLEWYLLDLLKFRDVSNEIAHRYEVVHQSPQILLIKKGKVVLHESHDGIDANDLKQFV